MCYIVAVDCPTRSTSLVSIQHEIGSRINFLNIPRQALHQLVDSQHETLREALRHADAGDEVVQLVAQLGHLLR